MTDTNPIQWGAIQRYLTSIGMKSEFDLTLTKQLFSHATSICPEQLADVFVSNYHQEDNSQQFKDLWFFSRNYVIEALNFTKTRPVRFELSIYSRNIQCVRIETSDFDLGKRAKPASRLHIEFYTLSDFSCDHIAFGTNCAVLWNIYTTYIKPNMVTLLSPQ